MKIAPIWDILNGNIKHWHKNNNDNIKFLIKRTEQFPPAIKPLLYLATMATYNLIEDLIGPTKSFCKIKNIKIKSISKEQFSEIHRVIIWSLISFRIKTNPQFESSFGAACNDFIGRTESQNKFIQKIGRCDESSTLRIICENLHAEIYTILKIKAHDPTAWIQLVATYAAAYEGMILQFNENIKKLRPTSLN